jgi:hypothetical protein
MVGDGSRSFGCSPFRAGILGWTGDGTTNSNRADMHNLTEQQEKDVVWMDGYRHGATDARADDEIEKEKARAAERRRIIHLLSMLPEHTPTPDIIEAVRGE